MSFKCSGVFFMRGMERRWISSLVILALVLYFYVFITMSIIIKLRLYSVTLDHVYDEILYNV